MFPFQEHSGKDIFRPRNVEQPKLILSLYAEKQRHHSHPQQPSAFKKKNDIQTNWNAKVHVDKCGDDGTKLCCFIIYQYNVHCDWLVEIHLKLLGRNASLFRLWGERLIKSCNIWVTWLWNVTLDYNKVCSLEGEGTLRYHAATLQDRLHTDRCSAFIFLINPTNHTFSESLIVPDYGSFF